MRVLWALVLWPCLVLAQPRGSEIPAKPAPDGLTYIDQGTNDPRLKGYRTPHGFKLEIVSEEPTIINPVGMTFGPDGTLYVIEWSPDTEAHQVSQTITYKDGTKRLFATMKKKSKDAVKKLVYDAGKKQYTQATIILEDELPSSILIHDGWLYTSGRGTVRRWPLADIAEGKNRQAKGQVIAQGFCGFHHHQVSGLTIGPDGWLYITSGDDDNVVEGSDGSRATVLRTGAVFRCRPDGSKMEVFSIGFRNPYRDLAHDGRGHWFHVDNDNEDGSKWTGCRLLHVAEDGDYGWRLKAGAHCCQPDPLRGSVAGERVGTMPPLLNTGRGAPAGLLYYNDEQFPSFYRRWLFYPDVLRRSVRAYKVGAVGCSFEVRQELALLTSDDPLFRPCQMVTGPDGAIYIADWRTDSGGAGRLYGDGLHGRIYRLSWSGGNIPEEPEPHEAIPLRPSDTWGKLASAKIDALIDALQGANATLRVLAQRELLRRTADAEAVQGHLLRLAADPEVAVETRLLCIGAFYTRWDAKARDLVLQHLGDQEPLISVACAELLGRMCDARDQEVVKALDKHLADTNNEVRRAVALALGRINGTGTIDALVATYRSDHGKDVYLTDGLVRAMERTGKTGLKKILELARSGNDAERDKCVNAFLALRTKDGADLLPELLVDPHLSPEQQVALVKSYTNYVVEPPLSLEQLPAIVLANKRPTSVAATAITVLADVRQLKGAACLTLVKSVLEDKQPALQLAAVQAIDSAQFVEALPLLRGILEDDQRPVELRLAAVRALRAAPKEMAPLISELLKRSESSPLRIEALRTLTTLDVALARTTAATMLGDKDVTLVREALNTVGGTREGAIIAAERFVKGELPREVLSAVADGLRRHAGDAKVNQLLTNVMKGGLLIANNAGEVEKIRQMVLTKGDAARGRSLYLHSKKLVCVQCHTMEGVGGAIGPDLTKLWDTGTMEKIIEAMLDPSKEIKEGFQTFTLRTTSGQTLSGLKISDTKEEVVIREATGNQVRVPRAKIEELKPSTRSLMPDDVVAQLSFDQFIDLVAFLKNRSAQESLRGIVTTYRVANVFDAQQPPERGGKAEWQIVRTQPNGVLDLKPFAKDNQPTYVACVAEVPKPQTTSLNIAANEQVRVWVNGTRVFERKLSLNTQPDGERVAIELKAGVNDIVLQVEGKQLERGVAVRFQISEGLRWRANR